MFLSILWQLQRLHTKTFTIEDRAEIIQILMYSFRGFYLNDSWSLKAILCIPWSEVINSCMYVVELSSASENACFMSQMSQWVMSHESMDSQSI